jgi:hypothetical protein
LISNNKVKPSNPIIHAQNHFVEIPDRRRFRLADSQSALTCNVSSTRGSPGASREELQSGGRAGAIKLRSSLSR